MQEGDAEQMWTNVANSIRCAAKRTLELTSYNVNDRKESWRWNEEVQAKQRLKNVCSMQVMSCQEKVERNRKKEISKVTNIGQKER